jgi:hypothetical protein
VSLVVISFVGPHAQGQLRVWFLGFVLVYLVIISFVGPHAQGLIMIMTMPRMHIPISLRRQFQGPLTERMIAMMTP